MRRAVGEEEAVCAKLRVVHRLAEVAAVRKVRAAVLV
jgi:hypothetical protein